MKTDQPHGGRQTKFATRPDLPGEANHGSPEAGLPSASFPLKTRLFFVKLFDFLYCLPKWRRFREHLMRVAATSPDFFFVQIGANDGVIYDPLFPYVRRYHWAGILVEPVPCYFERLKEHHRDNPGLIFENVAIAEHEGVRDFFRLREDLDFLPAWCHGLGTFHREVLLTHKWALPDIEDYIVTHQVPCITLSTLFHRHRVGTIDLFLVDTEGHDYQVLRQLDLDKIKPRLIVYEHRYFKPIDLKACESLLTQHNYSFDKHLGNTLAFLPDD